MSTETIAICSIIIAGLSFILTIIQSALTYKHNKLSIKPILKFTITHISHRINIKVTNTGIGPAILQVGEIFINEKYSSTCEDVNWYHNIFEAARISICETHYGKFEDGIALSVGENMELLNFIINDTEGKILMEFLTNHFNIRIKYKSIYGEHFQVILSNNLYPFNKK